MDRPLDGLERQVWLLARACAVHSLGLADVRGPVDPAALRAALALLPRRHPLLGVHVDEAAPGGPRYVSAGTPDIPLRVVPRRGDAHWLEEADRELERGFPMTTGPLMRAALVHGPDRSELLVAYDHLLGDATACFGAIRDALAWTAALMAGKEPDVEPLPERPPVSRMLPPDAAGPAARARLAQDQARLAWLLKDDRPAVLPLDADAHPRQRRSRMVHRALAPDEAAQLVGAAKREGTTVQGALCAAQLLGVAEELGQATRTLGCITPVNLRPHLTERVGAEFGLIAMPMNTFHRVSPARPFWDLAREVRRDVQLILDERRMLDRVLALDAAPRDPAASEALLELAERVVVAPVSVTNLGRLEAPPPWGPLRLERFHFIGAMTVGGASLTMAASTYEGRLTANFVHAEPVMAHARAERLADRALGRLREAAPSPR